MEALSRQAQTAKTSFVLCVALYGRCVLLLLCAIIPGMEPNVVDSCLPEDWLGREETGAPSGRYGCAVYRAAAVGICRAPCHSLNNDALHRIESPVDKTVNVPCLCSTFRLHVVVAAWPTRVLSAQRDSKTQ